ncbi:uncharacterized protein LOC142336045 isoform X2 [Convolutriloba macropyga]|uniref:uncharacterized protein LOC142336045 isoform X2 n=1 Tax=Convolutriloba macropyga TaxID=536237 RepID=UPI003F5278EC
MSSDGGDIAVETLSATNAHHNLFPSQHSDTASDIVEPQNDSKEQNPFNEKQDALTFDDNSNPCSENAHVQPNLQSKQGGSSWDPFSKNLNVPSISSADLEITKDAITPQTIPQNMDGAVNDDDDFADFDNFVDHNSTSLVADKPFEASTNKAKTETENPNMTSVQQGEYDSDNHEKLSCPDTADRFDSGERAASGDDFADFSGFEEANINAQIESVQSCDVEIPYSEPHNNELSNVNCSDTPLGESNHCTKGSCEKSEKSNSGYTAFEQGNYGADIEDTNEQKSDWADFGALALNCNHNDLQSNERAESTEKSSDSSENFIQIQPQVSVSESKSCDFDQYKQSMDSHLDRNEENIPHGHFENDDDVPPSGDQAVGVKTFRETTPEERFHDNDPSDSLKKDKSTAPTIEQSRHSDHFDGTKFSQFDQANLEGQSIELESNLQTNKLDVDENSKAHVNSQERVISDALESESNWAFFGTEDAAQNNHEFDDDTGFADFANFDTFGQSVQQDQEVSYSNSESPQKGNGDPFSQFPSHDQGNEDDFDDFEAFSEQQSMDFADHVGNVHEGIGPNFNHSNDFPERVNDARHSTEPVGWNRASPMPEVFRGFHSISEMLADVDCRTEQDVANEEVVTEDPLLIQDFFVSMSIASDVSKELNEEVESMWTLLADLSNSASLVLDVPNCILNSQLLSSLGVDVNNTLSTVKQNLPKYAAQLGLLQPMKSGEMKNEQDSMSATVGSSGIKSASNSQRNQNMMAGSSPTPDAVPDVEFDWGTSGLKNPLEMQSLSLDFFDSQFNSSSAASATSKLEEEFLSELGEEADSHSGFGGGGGGTNTNGSIGGTSRGATDSKLASILAVAQSSSHENVSVAVGGLNPSSLQNNNNDSNSANQLVFNPHSTNSSAKQSYKTTTSIQNGIGYFNGLQMMEKSTNCQMEAQRNYLSSNNQSYNHFSNCLPNKFGASTASSRTNSNPNSMSTNNNNNTKWGSWIFRRK